jgi:glycosyltransferase involved in cell wall biosynthesis
VYEITVLGMFSDSEAINLLRAAALVIQPSLSEGWRTVIQGCKALGRPLICSDIAIHRGQAPGALGFFPCDRSDVLADLLAAHWAGWEAGPNPSDEVTALHVEREFAC